MPEISRFFGIIIRMFYDEHNPPHLHAEYHATSAMVDFHGNVLRGSIESRTALRLIREWIDLHVGELEQNWESARAGEEIQPIAPLN